MYILYKVIETARVNDVIFLKIFRQESTPAILPTIYKIFPYVVRFKPHAYKDIVILSLILGLNKPPASVHVCSGHVGVKSWS